MAKLASSTPALDFLRRLLCAASTGGGDDSTTAIAQCNAGDHRPPQPQRSPGIVARLMGLDAMPEQPLRRSRSAGSADGLADPAAPPPTPRAVRTSASFREGPTYLRQENEEFLLLSFSPEEDEHEKDSFFASRTGAERLPKNRARPKKQRRSKRKQCDELELDRSRRPGEDESISGCDENSSPVSVLEQEESSTSSSLEEQEPTSPSSEEINPVPKQQSSRRKLSSDFDHFGNLSPPRSTCQVPKCSGKEKSRRVLDKAEVITPDVAGIWRQICILVEEDLKNMRWIPRDDAEIAAEIGSEILNQLICEASTEISSCL